MDLHNTTITSPLYNDSELDAFLSTVDIDQLINEERRKIATKTSQTASLTLENYTPCTSTSSCTPPSYGTLNSRSAILVKPDPSRDLTRPNPSPETIVHRTEATTPSTPVQRPIELINKRDQHFYLLTQMINTAQKWVGIISPYFSKNVILRDNTLQLAMQKAIERGVKITIISDPHYTSSILSDIEDINDYLFSQYSHSASAWTFDNIHSKIVFRDFDEVCIGSCNWLSAVRDSEDPCSQQETSFHIRGINAKTIIKTLMVLIPFQIKGILERYQRFPNSFENEANRIKTNNINHWARVGVDAAEIEDCLPISKDSIQIPSLSNTELILSIPIRDTHYDCLINTLNTANERVTLSSYGASEERLDWDNNALVHAINNACRRGVCVTLYVDRDKACNQFQAMVQNKEFLAQIKYTTKNHTKVLIKDSGENGFVILGSYNWLSATAEDYNTSVKITGEQADSFTPSILEDLEKVLLKL